MYKGFRLLAPLDLASIDFQTRFKKEKEKKNEEHHASFDPSCTFGCWVL